MCIGLTVLLLLISFTPSVFGSGGGHADSVFKHKRREFPANPQLCGQVKTSDVICFRPVGFFNAPQNQEGTTPHQGMFLPDNSAEIKIMPQYRQALSGLNRFRYVIVLYYFDRVETWTSLLKPPWNRNRTGLFATRTPRRPNPIGMTVLRLDSVDLKRGILKVSGVDAYDKTPVLDIKPFVPALDCVDMPVED